MAGDPSAQHQSGEGYRVPFAAGLEFPVSQAYPDTITHQTLDSRYAVDIAISEGTDILATRDALRATFFPIVHQFEKLVKKVAGIMRPR